MTPPARVVVVLSALMAASAPAQAALARRHDRAEFPRQESGAQRLRHSDGEQFDAMFVKVRLSAAKEVFAKGEQARVAIVAAESRKVVGRERLADVHNSPGAPTAD